MKKLISVALLVAMCVCLLAGCGSTNKAAEPVFKIGGTGPITGDITPYIAMGVLTMVALVSAAAYMLLKRKAI